MKNFLTLCAILFGSVALAADNLPSVLNHNAPAAAATPAPAAATEVVVVEGPRRTRCANGRCCTGPDCKLYSVNEESHEYVRNRVLGGQVIRRGSRTVVRPVR